jgi:hypothetical protein
MTQYFFCPDMRRKEGAGVWGRCCHVGSFLLPQTYRCVADVLTAAFAGKIYRDKHTTLCKYEDTNGP